MYRCAGEGRLFGLWHKKEPDSGDGWKCTAEDAERGGPGAEINGSKQREQSRREAADEH